MRNEIRQWVRRKCEEKLAEAPTWAQVEVIDAMTEAMTRAIWAIPSVAIALAEEICKQPAAEPSQQRD